MATYRSIAASETDANSPITQTLMEALADNPTAITEGATGAPRNVLKSLEELAVGDTTRSQVSVTTAGTISGYATVHSFDFIQIGTIRCVVNRISGGAALIGAYQGLEMEQQQFSVRPARILHWT